EMDDICSFCSIIDGNAPAYRVFESEHILAILADILPRTSGHVLVMPKVHVPLLSELPDDIARDLGSALTRVSRAMTQGLDNLGLTITLNQVYAQVVPHVHFHIVPAPNLQSETPKKGLFTRQELDEDEAEVILRKIKSRL
ncbi:hypothetical protein BS47DRAFT_1291133, partial [Hydnum rufescens UP504]